MLNLNNRSWQPSFVGRIRSRFGKYQLLVLAVLFTCMASVVLISNLFLLSNSLRLDEAQSLWQTSHSLRGLLKVVAQDVHVPLYHVILHFWQQYFGQGITTARLLSLTLFVLSIPAFYLLCRELLSKGWTLFAVALFSFSPFMNWYGSEARMYTLLALIAILNQYFFIRIVKKDKGWIGYLLTTLLGIYSHYFFFFGLFAQALFYLFNRRKFAPGSLKRFIGVALAAAVAIAPWMLYFRSEGSAGNTSPLLVKPSTVDFFNAFSQFSFGFQTNTINTILVSTWPLIILLGFFAIKRNHRIPKEVAFMAMAALIPVIVAYIISITFKPFFESRYMVSVIPPLTILVVWFISHYPKKLALAVSFIIAAGAIFGFYQQVTNPLTPVKENYRGAASYIAEKSKPEDIVVLSAPFTVYPFQYYYSGDAKIVTLPLWDRSVPGPIPAFDRSKLDDQVTEINRDHTYAYLLLSQDQGYETDVFQYYEQRFKRVEKRQFSDKINLYVYQVGYDQVPSLSLAAAKTNL